jgi:hypothetical protein
VWEIEVLVIVIAMDVNLADKAWGLQTPCKTVINPLCGVCSLVNAIAMNF